MKTSTLIKAILLATLILINYAVFSSPGKTPGKKHNRKKQCLVIEGELEGSHSKSSATYTVTLLCDNRPIESMIINEAESFKFSLVEGEWYAVEIKKEGCLPKLISVNTKLPKYMSNVLQYKLYCTVAEPLSYSEAKFIDQDVVDFPSAIISFDKRLDAFYVNEDYYNNIRKQVIESLVRN